MVGVQVAARRSLQASPRPGGAARGPTLVQWLLLTGTGVGYTAAAVNDPWLTLTLTHYAASSVFAASAVWRLCAAAISKPQAEAPALKRQALPSYTIIAALYHEGPVAHELVAALSEIDYPRDRLQIILVLEADDTETLDALAWLNLPKTVEVLVKRAGGPKTKPNALNAALVCATGRLLTVYDAEDRPHPGQLREAAARFALDPALACVQAPLRIANASSGFLARQFALEYASQFEVILPALARLGAAFPLGGTSNHFRTGVLRALGGWDAYNVTEDADLGFRLRAAGYTAGVIGSPTYEDAPEDMADWLPQRSRWIKGYMQTWGVHTRVIPHRRLRDMAGLQVSLGLAIVGAALHGPFILILIASALLSACGGHLPAISVPDFALLVGGWSAAILVKAMGAKRAGMVMRLADALGAVAYWPLQSLAFFFAALQLLAKPYHWDKTTHAPHSLPPGPARLLTGLDAKAA